MALESALCQMNCHFALYFNLFREKLLQMGNDNYVWCQFVNKMRENIPSRTEKATKR